MSEALEAERKYYGEENSIAYQSKYGQVGRFVSVLRMLDTTPWRSIYDVGCGSGDIVPWLCTRNPRMGRYIGCDITPGLLAIARENWQENDRINFNDGVIEEYSGVVDVMIGVGIFNIKAEDAWTHMTDTVRYMLNHSTQGVIFTMLTKKEPRDFEHTCELPNLVEFCESQSEKVMIDRSTLPYVATCGIFH